MSRKTMQWTIWALLMALFTALTLAGRWLDLALAMTLAGVLWYGIVPGGQPDDNSSDEHSRVRGR